MTKQLLLILLIFGFCEKTDSQQNVNYDKSLGNITILDSSETPLIGAYIYFTNDSIIKNIHRLEYFYVSNNKGEIIIDKFYKKFIQVGGIGYYPQIYPIESLVSQRKFILHERIYDLPTITLRDKNINIIENGFCNEFPKYMTEKTTETIPHVINDSLTEYELIESKDSIVYNLLCPLAQPINGYQKFAEQLTNQYMRIEESEHIYIQFTVKNNGEIEIVKLIGIQEKYKVTFIDIFKNISKWKAANSFSGYNTETDYSLQIEKITRHNRVDGSASKADGVRLSHHIAYESCTTRFTAPQPSPNTPSPARCFTITIKDLALTDRAAYSYRALRARRRQLPNRF